MTIQIWSYCNGALRPSKMYVRCEFTFGLDLRLA